MEVQSQLGPIPEEGIIRSPAVNVHFFHSDTDLERLAKLQQMADRLLLLFELLLHRNEVLVDGVKLLPYCGHKCCPRWRLYDRRILRAAHLGSLSHTPQPATRRGSISNHYKRNDCAQHLVTSLGKIDPHASGLFYGTTSSAENRYCTRKRQLRHHRIKFSSTLYRTQP